jgi:hypothetical protein
MKSGKSSILNSLTHSKHFGILEGIQSLTKKFKGRFASPDITFIDTPGFTDCSVKDNEATLKVSKTLAILNNGLNLILFCFSVYEIRNETFMRAGWKYLSLVLANAKYEYVSIVLTHRSCLASQELEEAVARMTTEFIPSYQTHLEVQGEVKVKDKILIYGEEGDEDGLDGVLGYITSSKGYRLIVMENLGKFWMPKDPLGSIEYLLQNAKILNQIQDLVLNTKDNHRALEEEVNKLKDKITSLKLHKDQEIKEEIEKVTLGYQETVKQELDLLEDFKNEMNEKLKQMKEEMNNKDKKIETLSKQIEDFKENTNKKESINTGIRNQNLQFDAKKYQLKTVRNYTDRSAILPGNYYIALPAEKYSDNYLAKVIERITSSRPIVESMRQTEENYQRTYKYGTPTLSKKAPENVQ